MSRGVKVTIQDIADKVGISKSTVSCALRNSPLVAKETLEKVQKAAEEMGYQVNPLKSLLMRQLRRKTSGHWSPTVAMLNFYPSEKEFHGIEGFSDRIKGARDRARQFGYQVEEFTVDLKELRQERLVSILSARGIYGVIIPHIPVEAEADLLRFQWKNTAVAVMGWALSDHRVHRAGGYQSHNMRLVYEKLAEKGYERIGFSLNLAANRRVDQAWRSSFINAQIEIQGEYIDDSLFSFDDPEFSETFSKENDLRFRQWLESYRPDAIIINSKREYGICLDCGLRVPEDMGVALLVLKPRSMPGFAGVDRNNYKIGTAAMDLVVEQLANNELGLPETPKSVLIDGRWVDGKTLL